MDRIDSKRAIFDLHRETYKTRPILRSFMQVLTMGDVNVSVDNRGIWWDLDGGQTTPALCQNLCLTHLVYCVCPRY